MTAAASARYAVIVITYQRDRELDEALAGVMAQTVGRAAMEICVVNNGGGELARERWKERVDVWLDAGDNLGCAGGRNRASELTSAPVLVFIDDDGVPAPDFIERLGDVLDRHPEAVAVRGRAAALHHPIWTTMATHYHRGPRECEDLLTLEGAAAIRRTAFEAAGGYDATRVYHEGLELSARLLELNPDAIILYTPDAVLRHDYATGVGHLLGKARALAAADDRLREQPDPRVQAVLKRTIRTVDGRRGWERLTGRLLHRGYRRLVDLYRLRRRLRRALGLSLQ